MYREAASGQSNFREVRSMLTRKLLVLVMVSSLTMCGWAAPSGVGTVQGSNAASVRGTALVAGTTLFSGDTVEVAAHGDARIALSNGSQLVLSANTRAQLTKNSSAALQVNVERGLAKFRSSEKTPVQAVLGDATIRTQNAAGVGYVNVVNSTSALIGADKGAVIVTSADGTLTTVPEGMALTVRMQQTTAAPPNASSGNKGTKILVGALIVGGLIAAAVAANQSENSQNVSLSPFKPN
jgi:FecR protein